MIGCSKGWVAGRIVKGLQAFRWSQSTSTQAPRWVCLVLQVVDCCMIRGPCLVLVLSIQHASSSHRRLPPWRAGGRGGRAEHRRARHADDAQDVPFCGRGEHERHAGRAAHQGDHQRRQDHLHAYHEGALFFMAKRGCLRTASLRLACHTFCSFKADAVGPLPRAFTNTPSTTISTLRPFANPRWRWR